MNAEKAKELIDGFEEGKQESIRIRRMLEEEIPKVDKVIISMDRILAVKGIPIPKTKLKEA